MIRRLPAGRRRRGGRSARRRPARGADVLTTYDWHGGYGHPDHVQVHRVGARAAAQVDGVRVLESTMNRDRLAALVVEAAARRRRTRVRSRRPGRSTATRSARPRPRSRSPSTSPLRRPEAAFDRLPRGQVSDSSLFLEMDDAAFARSFGTEWFIDRDTDPPMRTGWVFDRPSSAADARPGARMVP